MTDKRRALVLGGGGPVGVAWEAGLAGGLAASGVELAAADMIVGTSAGSIAGAFLASGMSASALVDDVAELFTRSVAGSGADQVDLVAMAGVFDRLIGVVADTDRGSTQERCAEVGQFALAATTISEDAFVGAIASALEGDQWPARFSCTAVDAATGAFQVWDQAAGASLARAVASSCSVPGIYPPITINGARYMDGGVRSPLNADLVAGHDVVVVVSPMPLALPPGLEDPRFQRFFAAQQAEIDDLCASGSQVELIAADDEFLAISGYGLSLMDFSIITPAVEAGVRLGKAVAERIRSIWAV